MLLLFTIIIGAGNPDITCPAWRESGGIGRHLPAWCSQAGKRPFGTLAPEGEMINQNDFTSPFGYTKGIKFTMDRFYAAGTEITLVTAFNNLSGLTGLNVNSGYLSLYKIAD